MEPASRERRDGQNHHNIVAPPRGEGLPAGKTGPLTLRDKGSGCREPQPKSGDPGEIRTPNLWNRNPLLYPVELRGRRDREHRRAVSYSMVAVAALWMVYRAMAPAGRMAAP
jgi:hypothetical protein